MLSVFLLGMSPKQKCLPNKHFLGGVKDRKMNMWLDLLIGSLWKNHESLTEKNRQIKKNIGVSPADHLSKKNTQSSNQ